MLMVFYLRPNLKNKSKVNNITLDLYSIIIDFYSSSSDEDPNLAGFTEASCDLWYSSKRFIVAFNRSLVSNKRLKYNVVFLGLVSSERVRLTCFCILDVTKPTISGFLFTITPIGSKD